LLDDRGLDFHDRLNDLLKLVCCFFLHACDDVVLFQYPSEQLVDIVERPCHVAFKIGLAQSFDVILGHKGQHAPLEQILELFILSKRDALALEFINHLTILIFIN